MWWGYMKNDMNFEKKQQICGDGRPQNDLFCVEWDVEP